MPDLLTELFDEARRDAQIRIWERNDDDTPAHVHVVGRNMALDRLRTQAAHERYIKHHAEPIARLRRTHRSDPSRRLQILELLAAVDNAVELATGYPSPVLNIVSRIVAGEVPGIKRREIITYIDIADMLGVSIRVAREIRLAMYRAFEELHEGYL